MFVFRGGRTRFLLRGLPIVRVIRYFVPAAILILVSISAPHSVSWRRIVRPCTDGSAYYSIELPPGWSSASRGTGLPFWPSSGQFTGDSGFAIVGCIGSSPRNVRRELVRLFRAHHMRAPSMRKTLSFRGWTGGESVAEPKVGAGSRMPRELVYYYAIKGPAVIQMMVGFPRRAPASEVPKW